MPNSETPKQRRERLANRVNKIRTEATERLTKDSVIQCRVESRHLNQLEVIAQSKGLSVSALTRMWLLERLQKERSI